MEKRIFVTMCCDDGKYLVRACESVAEAELASEVLERVMAIVMGKVAPLDVSPEVQ